MEDAISMDVDWDALAKEVEGKDKEQDGQDNRPTIPEGVDPKTWALALVMEEAKKDPEMAQRLAQLSTVQTAPQPQPQSQPAAEDPDVQRLNQVKARMDELRQKLLALQPDSEEYNRTMVELSQLEADRLALEPKVAVKSQIEPMRETQLNLQITVLMQYAQQRIASDPKLAALSDQAKQTILHYVQQGLVELRHRNPDELLSPNATALAEAIIRNVFYQVYEPSAPYDAAGNTGGSPTNELAQRIRRDAERFGIDPKYIAEELRGAMGGGH